jgi:uncharacterized protein
MKPLEKFEPIIPFWTGHSQTILGHLVPSEKLRLGVQSEIITLLDGDQLHVDWAKGTKPFTISLFHGLGGDAQADYIRRSANIAIELGWNIVLVNHRGASDKAQAKKSYHSGRGDDAETVISWCQDHFSDTKQIALGFSMSGSILLNLLSRRYGEKQPDYAIIVNAPLDLGRSSKLLHSGFSKIYDYRFYLLLKKMILTKEKMKLPKLGRVYDLDEVYTAKKNGFKDREDYYEKCSALNYVHEITTPTYILTSEDDPFVDVNDYRLAKWPTAVHLTITKFGGHMGYLSKHRDPKYGRRWLDRYIRTVLEKIQSNST